jgi:hypothetical protein
MKYRCPKCKSDNLDVLVEVWARLSQNEPEEPGWTEFSTDVTAGEFGDHEWGDNSPMRCRDCDHCAIAAEFKVEEAIADEEDKR